VPLLDAQSLLQYIAKQFYFGFKDLPVYVKFANAGDTDLLETLMKTIREVLMSNAMRGASVRLWFAYNW
jgi:hypothetical protein